MRPRARRHGAWTALAVTGGLAGACNAIFGIEDPVHRPDEATGGGAGEISTGGGATGGKSTGGTAGTATGGKSTGGTAGTATGGKGGNAGTTAGDAGAGGDAGSPTGGSATGGSGGDGPVCPEDPTDCDPSSPPSCAGRSKRACAGESCCSSPIVGGCTNCDFPSTHTSTVHDFRFDAFEVTVARFRAYVNDYSGAPQAGQGTQPVVPGTGWDPTWDGNLPGTKQALIDHVLRCGTDSTFTPAPGPNDQKPMNCMSWYEAFAFCVWDLGFLPTELQRTFAAANGAESRNFPWGDNLDHEHALWGFCGTGGSTSCQASDITDVGSFPLGDGAFGQHDLTGSMWEWVFDYSQGGWPHVDPCNDCVNTVPPTSGTSIRVIRGGGWSQSATEQPVPYRLAEDEANSVWKNVGLRCARGI